VTKPYLDLHESPQGLDNIPGLDGVRAISILIVMLSHSGLENVFPGVFGVTIFFFLSGFLITNLLLDEYSRSGTIHIGNFYVRRFLRLYPPLVAYIASVVVVLALVGKSVDGIGIAGALFYFANYLYAFASPHLDDIGVHLWSLSIEEHFYLFFPPLLLLLLNRRLEPVTTMLALCVLALAIRCILGLVTERDFFLQYSTAATEARFDSILFGCLTAVAIRQTWGPRLIEFATRPATVWSAVLLIAVLQVVPGLYFRQTLRFTLQHIALISLVLAAVYTPVFLIAKRALNHELTRWVAVLSYSLYLWHLPVIRSADYLIGANSRVVAVIAGWIASFAIAILVHFAIERPIVRWRKRFGSRAHEDIALTGGPAGAKVLG
jgi:peptidoglycan/LPS O-acetylase OafA/YrhL